MDARERVLEPRWLLSLPERGLVAFFFYTLLSYPFYLKYVAYSAYQTGFVAFLLAVIVFFVVEPRVLPVGRTALRHPPIALGVALYGVYVLAVGVASLLNAGEGYLIAELGRLLVKTVLGVAFVACVSERAHGWMLDRYTDVMLAAAIAGTIMVVGVALGWFSPIGTIQLPSAGLRDDGIRDAYMLGFAWGALPIPGGGKIIRLQSFADEPGTFAFALLIALIWSVHRRRSYCTVGLTVALLLTWSIGALVAGFGALTVYLWRRLSMLGLMALSVAAILTVVVATRLVEPWTEVARLYLQTKVGLSEGSSFGDRLSDIGTVVGALERHPFGLGGGGVARVVSVSLGVGWMRALVEAGFVGFTAYAIALGTLTWLGLRSALSGRGDVAALGSVIVILAFAGFQRARMDESIWHWWLIAAFVRAFTVARVAGNSKPVESDTRSNAVTQEAR